MFCGLGVGLRGGTLAGIIVFHVSGQLFALFLHPNQPNPDARDTASVVEFLGQQQLPGSGTTSIE